MHPIQLTSCPYHRLGLRPIWSLLSLPLGTSVLTLSTVARWSSPLSLPKITKNTDIPASSPIEYHANRLLPGAKIATPGLRSRPGGSNDHLVELPRARPGRGSRLVHRPWARES